MKAELIKVNKKSSSKILVFLVIFQMCTIQKDKLSNDDIIYEIIFGDHFKNDTIEVLVNNQVVLSEIELSSDPSDGITNAWIKLFKSKEMYFFSTNTQNEFKRIISQSNDLDLKIILMGQDTTFNLKDINGKYVVLASNGKGNIIFTQMVKEPYFD